MLADRIAKIGEEAGAFTTEAIHKWAIALVEESGELCVLLFGSVEIAVMKEELEAAKHLLR